MLVGAELKTESQLDVFDNLLGPSEVGYKIYTREEALNDHGIFTLKATERNSDRRGFKSPRHS